jgi:hypothetical protein
MNGGEKIMRDCTYFKQALRWTLASGLLLGLPIRAWAQEPGAVTSAVPTATESETSNTQGSAPAENAAGPATAAALAKTILIESIAAEGTHSESAGRVVVGESRLVPGRRYSEQEIAQAARRVKRLPFVLDARPVLRRGSAPDQYVLVFIVEEQSALSLAIMGDHWSNTPERISTGRVSPTFERFLGGLTQLSLSVDGSAQRRRTLDTLEESGQRVESQDTPLSANTVVGLTRYDIAGPASRLDIALNVGRQACTVSDFLDDKSLCNNGKGWGLNGRLLIPFARDNSLSLFAGVQVFDRTELVWLTTAEDGWNPRLLSPEEEYKVRTRRVRLGAVWAHDTTDDPVAALKGTQIVAGLSYYVNSDHCRNCPNNERPFLADLPGGALMLRLQHLFPLSHELTLSAVATPARVVSDEDQDSAWGEAGLGLRWVYAGRRNRYRLSLESGIVGIAGGVDRSRHWMPYSSLRFRSGLFVIALDARWVR